MYKIFVRPHLDYCDIIYHEPPKAGKTREISLSSLMEEIERIQYKAAPSVTGAWKGTNHSKIYDELGWEPLIYRRLSHRVIMLFKIVNCLIPYYLGRSFHLLVIFSQMIILLSTVNLEHAVSDLHNPFSQMRSKCGIHLCLISKKCQLS